MALTDLQHQLLVSVAGSADTEHQPTSRRLTQHQLTGRRGRRRRRRRRRRAAGGEERSTASAHSPGGACLPPRHLRTQRHGQADRTNRHTIDTQVTRTLYIVSGMRSRDIFGRLRLRLRPREAFRLRLRVKLFGGSGSGQNVPAPAAPAPMLKSSYEP